MNSLRYILIVMLPAYSMIVWIHFIMQKRVRMQQDSEDIQEQDNEPNANVVQSDSEQEQIADINSSPGNSDDSSETNDDEVQCNYIALGCVCVVCVVQYMLP